MWVFHRMLWKNSNELFGQPNALKVLGPLPDPLWHKSEVKSLSRVQLFATPWTVAYQPPQSMGFSRQEYWSGLPFPSLGDLPDPRIEPGFPTLQADSLPSELPGKPISLRIFQFVVIHTASVGYKIGMAWPDHTLWSCSMCVYGSLSDFPNLLH